MPSIASSRKNVQVNLSTKAYTPEFQYCLVFTVLLDPFFTVYWNLRSVFVLLRSPSLIQEPRSMAIYYGEKEFGVYMCIRLFSI